MLDAECWPRVEAVEALQSTVDFVNMDLKSRELTMEQKDYLIDALRTTREEVFVHVE